MKPKILSTLKLICALIVLVTTSIQAQVDTILPTLKVTYPLNNGLITEPIVEITGPVLVDPIVTVTGIGKDLGGSGFASISVSVNGGEPQSATIQVVTNATTYSTVLWQAEIVLQLGWNDFIAVARDVAGNVSLPTFGRYYLRETAHLTVLKNGDGSVSMASGNLVVGGSYLIEAKPAANYLFSNWLASSSAELSKPTVAADEAPPEEVSTSPKYAFAISAPLTLIANFIPNPFIPAAGKYHALFADTNGVIHQTAGLLVLTVRSNAAFTAVLTFDGDKVAVSGKFAPDGTVTKTISRAKQLKDDLTLTLALDFENDKVTGSVASTGWTSDLDGDKALKETTADNYTLLFPGLADATVGPPGYSFASARRLTSGFVKVAGSTADGLPFSQSLPVSRYDRFPLYAPLYKTTKVYANGAINRGYCVGSMLGWITFTNNAPSGTLSWNKTIGAPGLYSNGFAHEATLLGSHYTVPALGISAVNFANGTLTLTNGNLSSALIRDVVVKTNMTTITPTNNLVKITFIPARGLFSGSFKHPDNADKVTPIKGAVLQDYDAAGGYFLGIDQGGLTWLEAN